MKRPTVWLLTCPNLRIPTEISEGGCVSLRAPLFIWGDTMKRLLDYDDLSGVSTYFEGYGEDGFTLHYTQDAEPILEQNKQKQSMGREYYARDKDMWRVASIPVGIQMKWLIEHGVDVYNKDHWPKIRKLLNDPDYRWLKTAEIII